MSASIQKIQGSECIHTKDARFRVHPYKRCKVQSASIQKKARFRVHPYKRCKVQRYKRCKVQSVSIVYLKKGKGTKGGR